MLVSAIRHGVKAFTVRAIWRGDQWKHLNRGEGL